MPGDYARTLAALSGNACGKAYAPERHGDDDEPPVLQLFVHALPHGQVEATASPRRVGDEQDLLAAMIRQPMRPSGEIRQREVRRDEGLQRACALAS